MTRTASRQISFLLGPRSLWGVAGVASVVLLLKASPASFQGSWWILLPMYCLLAELLPVSLQRKGFKLVFTLPFLAALAVVSGPGTALLVDLAAGLVGRAILPGRNPFNLFSQTNLILSSVSGLIAGSLWATPLSHADPAVLALCYTVVHTASNAGLALAYERTLRQNYGRLTTMPILIVALYLLLPVCAATLAANGAYPAITLVLIPIFLLRMLVARQNRLQGNTDTTITALALMLQGAHPSTHRHLDRVAEISAKIARGLGLNSQVCEKVRIAAYLHDVGKIALDEKILDAPRPLSEAEFARVKRHPALGKDIVQHIDGLEDVAEWVGMHHERPDGKGYPAGLRASQIPVPSRIIAVVDAFDAMTGGIDGEDPRPYRTALSPVGALLELERCARTQFDARVVQELHELVVTEEI